MPREGHDDFELYYQVTGFFISIHVPREGHDGGDGKWLNILGISIHVPREGHD